MAGVCVLLLLAIRPLTQIVSSIIEAAHSTNRATRLVGRDELALIPLLLLAICLAMLHLTGAFSLRAGRIAMIVTSVWFATVLLPFATPISLAANMLPSSFPVARAYEIALYGRELYPVMLVAMVHLLARSGLVNPASGLRRRGLFVLWVLTIVIVLAQIATPFLADWYREALERVFGASPQPSEAELTVLSAKKDWAWLFYSTAMTITKAGVCVLEAATGLVLILLADVARPTGTRPDSHALT